MLTRPIPSSGEPLPVIGLGTYKGFDVDPKGIRRAELGGVLDALFSSGGSVIDSSPMYGRAEAAAGDLIAERQARDKVFIATKVWTEGRKSGIDQMNRSIKLLRTDHIDLMQIHNLVDWQTHLATLREWKAAGRIRYIGITHYSSSAHEELEEILRAEKLDFVQLNYSIEEREAEQRVLPLAAERGVAVLVNVPFGAGRLFGMLRGKPVPTWVREFGCETWSQVFLKFALANNSVTCAIPGSGDPAHMAENCRAGEEPMLDESTCKKLRELWDAR